MLGCADSFVTESELEARFGVLSRHIWIFFLNFKGRFEFCVRCDVLIAYLITLSLGPEGGPVLRSISSDSVKMLNARSHLDSNPLGHLRIASQQFHVWGYHCRTTLIDHVVFVIVGHDYLLCSSGCAGKKRD